jgi:hypothetical protein
MGMKDFSRPRKPIHFTIDDDSFDCAPAIPAETLMELTGEFAAMEEDDVEAAMRATMAVLEKFLLPKSFAVFKERMGNPDNPIEFPQVNDVVMWLLGEYGMRPTEQSSGSADGLQPPAPGTTSTGSTPDVVSTSSISPPTAS